MLALLLSGASFADENVTVRWSPPTECVDNTPIGSATCGALLEYRLSCASDPGPPYDALEWRIPAPATSDTRLYAPGDYFCRLSVSNEAGFSNWSAEEVFFSVSQPQSPPSPPTDVVVTFGASSP